MTTIEPRTNPLTIYQMELLQCMVRVEENSLRIKLLTSFIHLCNGLEKEEELNKGGEQQ
jgi:hypothetical protein